MSKYITKYPVNWIDGMKINKSHFIQEANATFDHIRDAISLRTTPVNYGILPPDIPNSEKITLKYWVEASNQSSITVRIMECQAVTYGGIRISVSEKEQNPFHCVVDIPNELLKNNTEKNIFLYLVLTINPFEKIPFGEIDPEEEPPRYPLVSSSFHLSIVGENELTSTSSFQLVLAKLHYQHGLVASLADYIPPCTSINSHPKLMEYHLHIVNLLLGIEHSSLQIIRKILAKKQNNQLAQIIKQICENILHYLDSNLSIIKESNVHQSPFEIIVRLAGLGRAIKNTIEKYQNIGKEELLNYLSDWLDMTQVDFEKLSADIVNVDYNHQDCQVAIQKRIIYLTRMNTLFQKLAELDYIGKKDDTDIFVGLNREDKQLSFWQRIGKRLFGL